MATTLDTSQLQSHLATLIPSSLSRTDLITSVLPHLLSSISEISKTLRATPQVTTAGSSNPFGDAQLNVDVLCENLIRTAVSQCRSIVTASSEEDPVERAVVHSESAEASSTAGEKETYTIAFDPLDGSSIIGPNWTVGSIIGLWDGPSALNAAPRKRQIGAILGVLGPRTTAIIALRIPGMERKPICLEVGFSEGSVVILRDSVTLPEKSPARGRYFAPANLRAAASDTEYMTLITHYISSNYTLRYSGGLVPDIYHALVKGHGIYLSPVTPACPAKLRRLYELAPIAMIVECAGGDAVDTVDGSDVLDRAIGDAEERGGLAAGNREEVDLVREGLLGQYVVDSLGGGDGDEEIDSDEEFEIREQDLITGEGFQRV